MCGQLSPLTLAPLEPNLYPAAPVKARVLAFWASRAEALLRFADAHGQGLVVPTEER